MSHGNSVLINALKRSVKMKNFFSGFIVTGTEKVRCGFGNGDCIMLDLEKRIFAAADGSERNPWASRDLLMRYQNNLSAEGGMTGIEDLKKNIKQIYSEQDFRHKTTFSSVWIEKENGTVSLYVASGGDSMVIVLDKETGSVEYKTEVDMKFAGRSLLEASMTKVELKDKKYRVILATDGYSDLVKQIELNADNRLHEILTLTDIHEVAESLLSELELNKGKIEYDDIGFIIFDPYYNIENSNVKLIIGGTNSKEERFYENQSKKELKDEWLNESFWNQNPVGLKLAGIVLN